MFAQFHLSVFLLVMSNWLFCVCVLWLYIHKFKYAHTQTRQKETNTYTELVIKRMFEAKAEYQQLNHSDQADPFSCKLQVTSLQIHISTTSLILSVVGGTLLCHRFSFNETKHVSLYKIFFWYELHTIRRIKVSQCIQSNTKIGFWKFVYDCNWKWITSGSSLCVSQGAAMHKNIVSNYINCEGTLLTKLKKLCLLSQNEITKCFTTKPPSTDF